MEVEVLPYVLRRTLSEYHFDNNHNIPVSNKLTKSIVIGARRPSNGDIALIYIRTVDKETGDVVEAHVEVLDPTRTVPLQETFSDLMTLKDYCKIKHLLDPKKVYQQV